MDKFLRQALHGAPTYGSRGFQAERIDLRGTSESILVAPRIATNQLGSHPNIYSHRKRLTSCSRVNMAWFAWPRTRSAAVGGFSGIWDRVIMMRHGHSGLTEFSVNKMEAGPHPFHLILLISLFFSSPVSSSTVLVRIEAGFALKLKPAKSHE